MKLQELQEARYHGTGEVVQWIKHCLDNDIIPEIYDNMNKQSVQDVINEITNMFGTPDHTTSNDTTWLNISKGRHGDEVFGIDVTVHEDGIVEIY